MYQEVRPTSVTVIGWAWIVIGALMVLSGVMALLASAMLDDMIASDPAVHVDTPLMLKFFPVIAIAQLGVAALGIVSGISFLKRKVWARKVLEVLSWLAVLFLVVFMIIWVAIWIAMTAETEVHGFSVLGIVMALGITAVYGVPFAIMIRYLRSEKVRNAMHATA